MYLLIIFSSPLPFPQMNHNCLQSCLSLWRPVRTLGSKATSSEMFVTAGMNTAQVHCQAHANLPWGHTYVCVGSWCPELSLWPSREAGHFCLGREGSFALLGLRRQHPEPPGSGSCVGPMQGWEEAPGPAQPEEPHNNFRLLHKISFCKWLFCL